MRLPERCRSWRPVTVDGHSGHMPSDCRRCWRPCHAPVDAGAVRCRDCETALAVHPDESVRLALISERDVSNDVVELLVTDLRHSVQLAAQKRRDAAAVDATLSLLASQPLPKVVTRDTDDSYDLSGW